MSGEMCGGRRPVRAVVHALIAFAVGATGFIALPAIASAAPPANDNFDDAQTLSSTLPVSVGGTSLEATSEAGEPSHGDWDAYASDWYKWTAPATGYVKISLCGGVFHNFAVYTGNALASLSTVVDSTVFGCSRTFAAISGIEYRIAVDDETHSSGSQASFTLSLQTANPPPNDQFADAEPIPPAGTSGVDGDNFDATVQPGEPTISGYRPPHKSVWYRWVAPANVGPETVVDACTSGPPFDTLVGVFTGTSVDSLTAEPVPFAGHTNCRYPFVATPGTVYSIMVDGFWDENPPDLTDEGEFTLTVDPDTRQLNDDFADAQTVGPGVPFAVDGSNIGATNELGEPAHAGLYAFFSVWYRWVAPSSGTFTFNTCDSDFDSVLATYGGGTVSGLTKLEANDDGSECQRPGANPTGSTVSISAPAGASYMLAVDGYDEGFFVLAAHAGGPNVNPPPAPNVVPTTRAKAVSKKKCRKARKLRHHKCHKKKKKKRARSS
jgi:hypothetical protein